MSEEVVKIFRDYRAAPCGGTLNASRQVCGVYEGCQFGGVCQDVKSGILDGVFEIQFPLSKLAKFAPKKNYESD